MRALVVYESMFGSTRAVAQSVAQGLGETMEVDVAEVGAVAAAPEGADLPDGVDLLVVGGPTHAFGMTRASTRLDAAKDATAPLVSSGVGIREWLDAVQLPARVAFATFDTKVATPNLPGSAARAAERRLRRLGGHAVVHAQTFTVHGKSDGLVAGQLEAAREWGRRLGTLLAPVG